MTAPDNGAGLARCVRRVLRMQVVLGLVAAVAVLAAAGPDSMLATLYGAGVGIANTLISARSAARTGLGGTGRGISLLPAYVGLVNKLLVIAGGIAAGAAVLALQPQYMIAGFVVLQAGFLACRPRPG